MTAVLVVFLVFLVMGAGAGLLARWSTRRWPLPAAEAPGIDPLDPEGNQRAVSRAVSVAATRVMP